MNKYLSAFCEIMSELFSLDNIIPILIMTVIVVSSGYLLFRFLERKHIKHRKDLKIGDSVDFSSDRYFTGEIIDMNENEVTVKTKIYKREIYKN